MSTDKKISSFIDYLKKSPISLTGKVLSLLSLLISVVLAVITNLRVAVIVLAVFGSVSLFMYNKWIARATQRSVIDPSIYLQLFSKRFRVWVHSISVCLLVLCWIIVACMTSNKCGGHTLFRLKFYKLAAKKLELYLKEPRNDYRAYNELAQCYDKLNKPKQYVESLGRLLKQKFEQGTANEKKSEIHTKIALTLSSDYINGFDNQYEKARVHIENARRLDPNSPVILLIQGFLTAYEAGDGDSDLKEKVEGLFRDSKLVIERMQLPEESYKYRSWFSQHHYWFGRALSELGDYERAKNELTAGLNTALKERRLSDWLEDFYFRLGQNEYRSTGEIDSADYYWQNISEKDYLERLLLLGYSYWDLGRRGRDKEKSQEYLKQALDTFSKAERSGLRTQKLFFMLGMLYFEKEDYQNAEANFKLASEKDPPMYLALYWLGRSCFMEEKLVEAKKALNDAKQLEPEDLNVCFWLGRILYKEGDSGGALKEFEKSIKFDNKNSEVYKWCICCLYTISEKMKDRYGNERVVKLKRTLTYTKQGIESSKPENGESTLKVILGFRHLILNNLACVYAERGESLIIAEAYIDKALDIAESQDYPFYMLYLDTKAWVIIKRTEKDADLSEEQKRLNYEKAEELLDKSLRLLSESLQTLSLDESNPKIKKAKADILFHLGYLEKLRGNKAKAEGYFIKCLELDPEHRGAEKELE